MTSFIDMTGFTTPTVTEIDGVTIRRELLASEAKVEVRATSMLNWLPTAVWNTIKTADVDLLITESIADAHQHGKPQILSNDRLCLTIDPTVLRSMYIDHPFSATEHMIVFFETLTDRELMFGEGTEEEKTEAVMQAMAQKLEDRGVIKSAAKRLKFYRRVHWAQKTAVNTAEALVKRLKR